MKRGLFFLVFAATLAICGLTTPGTVEAQEGSRSGYSFGGYHRTNYRYNYGANYGGYFVPGRSFNRGYDYGYPGNFNRGYGYGYADTYYSPGVLGGARRGVGASGRVR